MRSKLAIAFLIAGLLSIGAWSGYGQTRKSRKVTFQYNVIYDPTEKMGKDEGLKVLDELGAQGWEIVGTSQAPNAAPLLYLKRTIQ